MKQRSGTETESEIHFFKAQTIKELKQRTERKVNLQIHS